MSNASKVSLTAQVVNCKNKPGSKVRSLTNCTIRLNGKQALAFRTLGGKYTAEQALREFRKQPHLFAPQPGFNRESVAFYATAA